VHSDKAVISPDNCVVIVRVLCIASAIQHEVNLVLCKLSFALHGPVFALRAIEQFHACYKTPQIHMEPNRNLRMVLVNINIDLLLDIYSTRVSQKERSSHL